jgi:hypothetical protein
MLCVKSITDKPKLKTGFKNNLNATRQSETAATNGTVI